MSVKTFSTSTLRKQQRFALMSAGLFPSRVEVLAVAGGASGGGSGERGGGGGGGGGAILNSFFVDNAVETYVVTIGSGGAPVSNGSPTLAEAVSVVGGARGAAPGAAFAVGSSGGGGFARKFGTGSFGSGPGSSGIAGQGHDGASTQGSANPSTSGWGGGGGGGGGPAPGPVPWNNRYIADGGVGLDASDIFGTSVGDDGFFAGGGGGGGEIRGSDFSKGGKGGGGDGGNANGGVPAKPGSVNTGGGGGGTAGSPASGGSGVVLLKVSSALTVTPGASHSFTQFTSGGFTIFVFTAGDDEITIG